MAHYLFLQRTWVQFLAPHGGSHTSIIQFQGDVILVSGLLGDQECTWYLDIHAGKTVHIQNKTRKATPPKGHKSG